MQPIRNPMKGRDNHGYSIGGILMGSLRNFGRLPDCVGRAQGSPTEFHGQGFQSCLMIRHRLLASIKKGRSLGWSGLPIVKIRSVYLGYAPSMCRELIVMLIVSSVPVLVSRMLPLIIFHMPSSGYFDESIRSISGLSTVC
jgi:hypothetical protein